jgi:hypothetical protein
MEKEQKNVETTEKRKMERRRDVHYRIMERKR